MFRIILVDLQAHIELVVGQEFDNAKKFKNFLIEKTSKPYHCLIYIEDGDDINTKYMEYKAPSDYPDIIFKF